MEVPQDLGAWTLATVETIVRERELEPGQFEYKASLRSYRPEDAENHRNQIRKAVCSMANTAGGYLLFGVQDRKGVSDPKARISGMPPEGDHLKEFGDQTQSIRPELHFSATTTPIALPNGRVLFVVYVPPSPIRPHEFNGVFYKRGDGGQAVPMDAYEVRDQMQNVEERIRKLGLLLLEIRQVRYTNRDIHSDPGQRDPFLSAHRFDSSSIKTLVADTCILFKPDSSLSLDILTVVRLANQQNELLNRCLDYKLKRLELVDHRPFNDWWKVIESIRGSLDIQCTQIEKQLVQRLETLTGRKSW